MKTHVKLLVLAMVLVMFTFCLAACVGGIGGGDTTTEATTTTEAPAVTTTTAGDLGYDPADFGVIVPEEVPYTGSAIDVVDVFKASGTKTSIKYTLIDANENVIRELGTTKPVDCGTYKVTVTFSWTKNDKTDPLPAPMTAIFNVVPGSLAAVKDEFGAKEIEILFKSTGMSFNPVGTAMQTGFLPDGIISSASIVKIANATDTGAGTPVAEAGKITSADGAGYFRVTFTYAEEEGLDNYTDEATVSYSAVVYARAIEKTVAKVATAPTMTGNLSQYGAALFESEYQAAELKDGKTVNVKKYTPEPDYSTRVYKFNNDAPAVSEQTPAEPAAVTPQKLAEPPTCGEHNHQTQAEPVSPNVLTLLAAVAKYANCSAPPNVTSVAAA